MESTKASEEFELRKAELQSEIIDLTKTIEDSMQEVERKQQVCRRWNLICHFMTTGMTLLWLNMQGLPIP